MSIIFLIGILKLFSVVNENVSLVISRQILTDVSTQLTVLSDPISKAVSHYTLDKVNFMLLKIALE
jgi:COP9 signalosome complex subunit 4